MSVTISKITYFAYICDIARKNTQKAALHEQYLGEVSTAAKFAILV